MDFLEICESRFLKKQIYASILLTRFWIDFKHTKKAQPRGIKTNISQANALTPKLTFLKQMPWPQN